MSLNEIVKTMQDAVNRQTDQAKPGGYDTTATVRRIEGDTAFVHIPGGVDETPVKLTINAKAGDNVQVRVSGGNAFLVGNGSSPPTDDARANQAYTVATVAEGAAENALANAARAAEAADSAQTSATRAESAAGDAVIAAGNAQTAAGNAQTAADNALVSLSTVEDVVGVLNWITEHGTMTLTSDVTVNPEHVYFIVDPAGDYVVGGTHYSIVSDPKDADLSTYYELTVDESVENYVATHVAVDTEGLWIIPDAGGNKVLIATGSGSTYTTAGTYIVGKVNGVDAVFAKFTADGATMQRGSTNIAHLGYGPGISSGGGTSDAPYYTIGLRSKATNVYDSTIRYYVGDLVLYGNPQKEYCCKVDIETPEAWTPSHWQLSIGNYSTEEGQANVASGYSSHAEGSGTKAFGYEAHSEGSQTIALGDYSHAEGMLTTAGFSSHAEGVNTTASGDEAHAEGFWTTASGTSSHAEGEDTIASGWSSHAQNLRTIAGYNNQTAIGKFNDNQSSNALEIGNGTDINARSNALTVDWSGNVEAAGDVTDGAGNTLSVLGDKDAGRVTVNYSGSSVSASSGTWKDGGGKTLDPGIWVVAYGVGFSSNANGNRSVNFGTSVGDGGRYSPAIRAASGTDTRVVGIRVINVATSATYKVSGMQNSGSSLTMYPWFDAVCVKPFLS